MRLCARLQRVTIAGSGTTKAPTALDAESVEWLENHLSRYAGAVLAVTHDRYFLDNVAQWILELDRGRAYPYEGNYS